MISHPRIVRGGTIHGGGHRSPSFVHCFSWQHTEAALDNDFIWNGGGPFSAMNRSEADRRDVVRILVQWVLVLNVPPTLQFLHRLEHRIELLDCTYPVRLHTGMNGAPENFKAKCQRPRLHRPS